MLENTFNPFYERWAEKLGCGAVGKIVISMILGLTFFLPYYSIVGSEALHNWSWLLALLTSTAMLFLFYATATLKNLFPVWTSHIENERAELYMEPLIR